MQRSLEIGFLCVAITLIALVFVSSRAAGTESESCLGLQATIVVRSSKGNVKGTPHADVIVARRGSHTITGGGGNDRVCGGQGHDRIFGGGGSDWIEGAAGADVLEGGNGSDHLFGAVGADLAIGNRGNDQIYAGAGDNDFVDGGLGDDLVVGGSGSHDRVIGGVGNDRLEGGPGDEDVLRGDHGSDLFDGGAGEHDVASFAVSGFDGPIEGGQGVVVDLTTGRASQDGTDRLMGIEDVVGTAFADFIRGNQSNNVLFGGGGDDRLLGLGVGDKALGGAGTDVCEGMEEVDSCGTEARPSGPAVEVALSGGAARGSLTVVAREATGVPGGPIESVPTGFSAEAGFEAGEWIVMGGPGLFAGEGCAALGAQVRCPVSGKPDAVLLSGSGGNDRFALAKSVPVSVEGILQGDAGSDYLLGGSGDDSLNGGARPSISSVVEVLRGGAGDDALTNGTVLLGEAGSDLIIASPCGGQRVEGGAGVDSASFARSYLEQGVQVRLGGFAVFPARRFGGESVPAGCPILGTSPSSIGSSIENVEGSPLDDVLIGDKSDNILLGRGGDDVVLGGGGNDFLVGGTGVDGMTGGLGNDRLYARDGKRDGPLRCGPRPSRLDVAKADPADPVAQGCRMLP